MPLSEENMIDEAIDVPVNEAHRKTQTQSQAHADERAGSVTGAYEPLARNYFDQNEHADHNCRNDRKDGSAVQEEADVDQSTAECGVRQCDWCGQKYQVINNGQDNGVGV